MLEASATLLLAQMTAKHFKLDHTNLSMLQQKSINATANSLHVAKKKSLHIRTAGNTLPRADSGGAPPSLELLAPSRGSWVLGLGGGTLPRSPLRR